MAPKRCWSVELVIGRPLPKIYSNMYVSKTLLKCWIGNRQSSAGKFFGYVWVKTLLKCWIWNRQSSIWKCLDRSSEKNSNNHFKTRWWPYLCDIPVTRCRRCLKSWRLKRWRRVFRPSSREPSRPYWTIGPFSPGTLSSKSCPSLVQTARHTHQTQALQTHSPTRPKQHPRQKHLCKNSGRQKPPK